MLLTNQKGQTLLEVTISVGVAVIIITALTIVTITGLRNAEFAQNQTLATKLAQDWLDQVRSFRDQNSTVCNADGSVTDWNSAGGLFAQSCASACTYLVKPASASCRLDPRPVGGFDTTQKPFSKQISISDYGINQKKVTSLVQWTDFSGTHQSQLVEILSKP